MTDNLSLINQEDQGNDGSVQYVTVYIGGQLFGLPIAKVHDVFTPDSMTRVPLSPSEVAGILNLRGRIVTAIDMRRRLSLPPREGEESPMAVGIEFKSESYGLIIDSVGEVLMLETDSKEPNPANLDPRWSELADGVHRLDGKLMIVLDVERLLSEMAAAMAA